MALVQIRYVGDEPREVSILPAGVLRPVQPDDVFDVDELVADSYSCQPHFFQPGDGSKWPEPPADEPDEPAAPPADDKPTPRKAAAKKTED